MALPNAGAAAQIATGNFLAAWVAYLDIVGDPVRVCSAKANITFSSTGDADLDGFTYSAVDTALIEIAPAKSQDGGSETMGASLSGIVGPDTTMLNAIGTRSNWQGRVARFWTIIYDLTGVQQGAIWNWYTGRMSAIRISGSPGAQTVELDIESYLAILNGASGRTYMDQEYFDSGDYASRLKLGAANGARDGVANPAGSGGLTQYQNIRMQFGLPH